MPGMPGGGGMPGMPDGGGMPGMPGGGGMGDPGGGGMPGPGGGDLVLVLAVETLVLVAEIGGGGGPKN